MLIIAESQRLPIMYALLMLLPFKAFKSREIIKTVVPKAYEWEGKSILIFFHKADYLQITFEWGNVFA